MLFTAVKTLVSLDANSLASTKLSHPRPRPGQVDLANLASDWNASTQALQSSLAAQALRRVLDIVLSMTGLVLAAPVLLIMALLIKLDDAGPAFYRQERVGLGGKAFTLLKLRSMRTNAELFGPCWASQHDRRVTRLGRVLRLTRLDELPQLFNVLEGSMTLVGPRPERPHFTSHLTQVIPHFAERVAVKPGITGWAQVNYRYGASVEDARQKLAYDLYYIKHRSLRLDLSILFSTVFVILNHTGAR